MTKYWSFSIFPEDGLYVDITLPQLAEVKSEKQTYNFPYIEFPIFSFSLFCMS